MLLDYSRIHTEGKISIEHITYFWSKYFSKGSVGMTFSPEFSNNPVNPHMQRNQTTEVHKSNYMS